LFCGSATDNSRIPPTIACQYGFKSREGLAERANQSLYLYFLSRRYPISRCYVNASSLKDQMLTYLAIDALNTKISLSISAVTVSSSLRDELTG
jgi:hypothetical protein